MSKLEQADNYNQDRNVSPNFTVNYQQNLNIESLPIDSKSLIDLHNTSPELANKVIDIVASEQKSRHTNITKQLELDNKALSFNMLNISLATTVIFTILISSTVLILKGYEILGGSVLGLSALSGILKFFSSGFTKK